MDGVATIFLALFGLVEFVLRVTMMIVLIPLTCFLILFLMDDMRDVDRIITPVLWGLIHE